MSDSSNYQSDFPPQNALDRLMLKALENPALHGEMFRLLLDSELSIFVPPHPEMIGESQRSVDEGLTWCSFNDAKGQFTPVFTSENRAEYAARNITGPEPMIASLPGNILFAFLNDGQTTVRLMASGNGVLTLDPEAVNNLATGYLTHLNPNEGERRTVTMHNLPADQLPPDLCQAIRAFCDKRPIPLGIYAFHRSDPDTGEIQPDSLQLVLWLRSVDNHFYNDFNILAQRLLPPHLLFYCDVVTSDNEAAVTFLQGRPTIWPLCVVE